MPPTRRPFPRFIADASQESSPYGRWGERLLVEGEEPEEEGRPDA